MCLYVDHLKESQKAVLRIRKANKPVYAYKVMTPAIIGASGIEFCGIYFPSFRYKNGINVSNRRSSKMTSRENKEKMVMKGFHCYMRLKDAIELESRGNHRRFFRVKINPKDVVAFGDFCNVESIVCTKFTVDINKPSKHNRCQDPRRS